MPNKKKQLGRTVKDIDGLMPQERVFAENYILTNNASSSAVSAGYSDKAKAQIGFELLTRPHIQAFIQKKKSEVAKEHDVEFNRFVAECAAIGFSNIKNYYKLDENGQVIQKDIFELTDFEAAAIEECTTELTKTGAIRTTFKLFKKKDGLDLIGKSLGYFLEGDKKSDVRKSLHERIRENYDNLK